MRTVLWLSTVALVASLAACDKKPDAVPTEAPAPSSPPVASGAAPTTDNKVAGPPAKIDRLNFPGTEEGARALLGSFLKSDADRPSMTRSLRPSTEDYQAIFDGEAVTEARAKYEEQWSQDAYVIEIKEGQTELQFWKATTEELRDWTGDAHQFPGGYRKVADKLKPGLTFYRFKFVKPGDKHGMTYDGLVFVNDHWVLVSKPYRIF
jgi:hypothetical protein